jgi:uncharacterized protein YfiM (DUF2279 family)
MQNKHLIINQRPCQFRLGGVVSLTSTCKSLFIFFLSIFTYLNMFAQDSDQVIKLVPNTPICSYPTIKAESIIERYPYSKKKVRTVVIANVVGYGAIMYGLSSAWYSGYPKSKFHSFDDNGEWLQIDKIGHALSAYAESNASYEVWRWTGISRKKRILLGGLSGAAYQTIIETLDGFSSEWGWSWGDFGANIVGSGIFTAQEFAWDEQRIRLNILSTKKFMTTSR